jgi:ubiquinone/menaquinone biosynthesis C-methylase UbiE
MPGLIEEFAPVLGEFAWHSLTRDPRITAVSDRHFEAISQLLDRHGEPGSPAPPHVLEVASYAHLTGHTLAERRGARVTLFDISARALALGRQMAGGAPEDDNPRLVMGDFHDLPFEDESFDLVFISSAIHHTLRWSVLVAELQRVLNAGGLLLIDNEPCRRACCTYSFRTNREDQLTAFERKLESLGVIRTFAEPYLGSRPETLFGMVENQQIPLGELLEQLDGPTEILEATFSPELCMGWLESQWVELRGLGDHELASIISGDLRAGRRQALAAGDSLQAGMGLTLPEEAEIDRLAGGVAEMICSLPPPEEAPQAYRRGLAEIFGAAVRVAARKRGTRSQPSSSRLKTTYPRFNGVVHTLRGKLGRMLRPGGSRLPDIQSATAEELSAVLPGEHWHHVDSDGLASMHLRAQPGVIRLPPGHGDRILICRFQCVPPTDQAARVSLHRGNVELFTHHCWVPEGFLCITRLPGPSAAGETLQVHCQAERDGTLEPLEAGLAIAVLAPFEEDPPAPALQVVRVDGFEAYERHLAAAAVSHELRRKYEESLIDGSEFTVPGHCHPCGRPVDFEVDLSYGFEVDGEQVPNWRERLICPHCGLNNRMRAAVHLAQSILGVGREDRIYLTEATTPLYTWFERKYADVVGSEHLGPETPRGTENRDGLRNEDLTRLTFAEATFDLVVCFDVLEHVPDYRQALRECHRVLRPGGKMLLTVPFRRDSRQNVVRARLLESGEIEHLLPPQFHGDPLDSDGCLAFYEFGWELLDELREIGFARVSGLLYWSLELGYLGVEQIAFAAFKDGPEPPRRARPEESP